MNLCVQKSRARRRKIVVMCELLSVVAALLATAGCQGISGASKQETQIGTLSLSGSTVAFGSVTVGTTKMLTATATNNGTAAVTVNSAVSSASQFSLNQPALPMTLAVGQNVTLSIGFTPTAAGDATGNLTISSDASDSPVTVTLTGNGVTDSPGTLSPSQASLDFSNVLIGSKQTIPETLTNAGGSSLTITQATASGAGFSFSGLSLPLTLSPGQSSPAFNVVFAPQAAGTVSGNLAITSNASNPTLDISLSGTGATSVVQPTLTPTQSSLSFGSVQVGNNKSLSETVTNTGGSLATISQDTLSGSAFTVTGLNPPVTLSSGQSLTFSVIFTPPSASTLSGNLALTSNASNPTLNIPLSGTGTAPGQLSVTSSLAFGNVVVGTSANLPASLSATGATVTITSVNLSSSEFTLSGITFPATLAAGNTLPFTVTFTPQATGTASGSASFASNASNSPSLLSLGGTGTAPPVHTVQLSWTASTSSNINGYNLYRGTSASGPFTQINPSLISNTSYTDNSVVDGTTYYYEATAVDSNNQESAKSTPAAQAIIPAP